MLPRFPTGNIARKARLSMMTPDDFKGWRRNLGLTQSQAAAALGLSLGSIENYERGARREDGRPVAIPRTVELACFAVSHALANDVSISREIRDAVAR